MMRTLCTVYDKIVAGFAWISMITIFAIIFFICVDVVCRYFFNQPIGWVYEFVEHGLVVIVFLGVATVTREHGHVTVDILTNALPESICRRLRIFSYGVTAIVTGLLGCYAWLASFDSFQRGVATTGVYPIPRGLMVAIVAIGFCLTALECLRIAVIAVKNKDAGSKITADPSVSV